MFKRGEIYLVNFNPRRGKEVGKLRPALIIQSDALNEVEHPTIIVLPLTTKLVDLHLLRYRVRKRGQLEQDSDVLLDQIRAIDIQRIKSPPLARLNEKELIEIEEKIKLILDFS